MDNVALIRRPTVALDDAEKAKALQDYAEIERKVKQLQTPLPDLLDRLLAVGSYDLPQLAARLFV